MQDDELERELFGPQAQTWVECNNCGAAGARIWYPDVTLELMHAEDKIRGLVTELDLMGVHVESLEHENARLLKLASFTIPVPKKVMNWIRKR